MRGHQYGHDTVQHYIQRVSRVTSRMWQSGKEPLQWQSNDSMHRLRKWKSKQIYRT